MSPTCNIVRDPGTYQRGKPKATGLPLPFVSYGGSAIFADMIAIGLLQSVHRRRKVFE